MFTNKIVFVIAISFFLKSCGGWDSVKRGITGAKQKTGDEFLVKKKDPLVLPPNYDNLPTPDERTEAQEEVSSIEQSLTSASEDEDSLSLENSSESSTEKSILNQIKKN